jgi:SAM-dependent methyltransferase
MIAPENITSGVKYLSNAGKFSDFQEKYLDVRKKESRLYTDDEVRSLPYLHQGHPHQKEWLLRADSINRFLKYLRKKSPQGPILDLGCGNGWFANKMVIFSGQEVVGLDVNIPELEQAARVFQQQSLSFCFGDIFEDIFHPGYYKMIVLNASAQYFPDIRRLIHRLVYLLEDEGEIHLLDTHFYPNEKSALKAAERTLEYYTHLGFPEMASHYYHHQIEKLKDIDNTRYKILHHNSTLNIQTSKLLRRSSSPFPWIRISK